MDIELVLSRCHQLIEAGGGVATFGSRSIWGGTSNWELAVVETVKKWLGSERRAGTSTYSEPPARFEDLLRVAGFENVERFDTTAAQEIDIPYIIGHLYSTSYCNRALLGDRAGAFEADLRKTLESIDPSGRFTWHLLFNLLTAIRRG